MDSTKSPCMSVGDFSTGSGAVFVIPEDEEEEPVHVLRVIGDHTSDEQVLREGKKREVKLFGAKTSPLAEMERLQQLQKEHPEYAKAIVLQGIQLVQLASVGALDALVDLILSCREEELLQWTTARMFKVACLNGHENVVQFMLQNGMDSSHPAMRHILHELVEEVNDEQNLVRVLPLLIRESDFNINTMRRGDGVTVLHIACRRALLHVFKVLILLGADIHAVANDDSLPLTCANQASLSAETTEQVLSASAIVQFLGQLGAADHVQYMSYSG